MNTFATRIHNENIDYSEKLSTVDLEDLRDQLTSHAVYRSIKSINELKIFMEAHVYAVWDFMSLTKRLQNSLTCNQLPWLPVSDSSSARFINEIVLNEESDLSADGGAVSHLEMYLQAMEEVGASTWSFNKFANLVSEGVDVKSALAEANAPVCVRGFVSKNVDVALNGSLLEVAATFFYSREDVIPDMFRLLIDQIEFNRSCTGKFEWYLARHIQLDGDEHGPAAEQLLANLSESDDSGDIVIKSAAKQAIYARITLWDGILDQIEASRVRA